MTAPASARASATRAAATCVARSAPLAAPASGEATSWVRSLPDGCHLPPISISMSVHQPVGVSGTVTRPYRFDPLAAARPDSPSQRLVAHQKSVILTDVP